jgi:phospholipase C
MPTHNDRRNFLKLAGLAAGGAMLPPSIARAASIAAHRRSGTIEDVEHVVILMQENRSFDHYYGSLRGVQGFADPFPVPLPHSPVVWDQLDREGKINRPFHLDTKATAALKVDVLPHSWSDANEARRGGHWDGWIPAKTPLTMGHYRREDIAFQYALAETFTLCDAYHCSIHGQTNPNRLFIWAGGNDPKGTGGGPVIANDSGMALDVALPTTPLTPQQIEMAKKMRVDGRNFGRGPRYTYATYPERLEAAGISWKVYQDPKDNFLGLTNPAVAFKAYNDAAPGSPLHDKAMSRWTVDDLRADVLAGRLPQVSWIASSQSQSEHPFGSSPLEGAAFTAKVLDALTANPDVWAKTVLFLNFDENDGFFDHVSPPAPPGVNPDGSRAGASTIDTDDDIHWADKLPYGLGVRVPMTVISPWSKGGWVNSQVFDHTSVIRFLETRFGVHEPNITAWRRAVCGDLTSTLDFSLPRPGKISLPALGDVPGRIREALKMPKPRPPAQPEALLQEQGLRPSRALPYDLDVTEQRQAGFIALTFHNLGKAAADFQVHDLNALEELPRHYTVEPGKTLSGQWPTGSGYHLQVRGPNQWFREYAGRGDDEPAIAMVRKAGRIGLQPAKAGNSAALTCHDRFRPAHGSRVSLRGGATAPVWEVAIARTGNWYDLELVGPPGSPFRRRFSGRVEDGAHGWSRPGVPDSR